MLRFTMLTICFVFFFSNVPFVSSTITMISVWGTPNSTVPLNTTTASWEDCVTACYSDEKCQLAHGRTSDNYCANYGGGAVSSVLNEKSSPTGNMVSFKTTGLDQCPVDSEDCFGSWRSVGDYGDANGKVNVACTEESYTLSYQCSTVGDWYQYEAAVCNSPCDTPMFTYPSGTFTNSKYVLAQYQNATMEECARICWLDESCFLTLWRNAPPIVGSLCKLFPYGSQFFTVPLDKDSMGTSFVSLKLKFDASTCNLNLYYGLLDSKTYAVPASSGYDNVTFNTEYDYFVGYTFKKSTAKCTDFGSFFLDGVAGCYQIFSDYFTSIDYVTAQSQCISMGGDGLMVLPTSSSAAELNAAMKGFTFMPLPSYIGLTRDSESSDWKWSLPSLILDSSGIPWASGQPGSGLCATLGSTNLTSADCSTGVKGYYCHLPA